MIGCEVTEIKSGEKKQCQFPFTADGETFHQCTDKVGQTTFEKPWCSTKTVRKNGKNEHVTGGGYYGDCNCLSTKETVKDLRQGKKDSIGQSINSDN